MTDREIVEEIKVTDKEIVEEIIRQRGKCHGIACGLCPLGSIEESCLNNKEAVILAEKWLKENCPESEVLKPEPNYSAKKLNYKQLQIAADIVNENDTSCRFKVNEEVCSICEFRPACFYKNIYSNGARLRDRALTYIDDHYSQPKQTYKNKFHAAVRSAREHKNNIKNLTKAKKGLLKKIKKLKQKLSSEQEKANDLTLALHHQEHLNGGLNLISVKLKTENDHLKTENDRTKQRYNELLQRQETFEPLIEYINNFLFKHYDELDNVKLREIVKGLRKDLQSTCDKNIELEARLRDKEDKDDGR